MNQLNITVENFIKANTAQYVEGGTYWLYLSKLSKKLVERNKVSKNLTSVTISMSVFIQVMCKKCLVGRNTGSLKITGRYTEIVFYKRLVFS